MHLNPNMLIEITANDTIYRVMISDAEEVLLQYFTFAVQHICIIKFNFNVIITCHYNFTLT